MGQSQGERERGGEEGKRGEEGRGAGPRAQIKERERNRRGGEKVSGQGERNRERGESSDSGALTQRCVTLKAMCWLWEVVLLSQMTSASLLKTIG